MDSQPASALLEIKRAIPAHLFKSSFKTSVLYLIRDLFFAAILLGTYVLICNSTQNVLVRTIATIAYWLAQGTVFWALFCVGHDCGHGSFSRFGWANDLIGTVVHGLILVPYYPWKMSHQHHHKNTGNIDKDEIFFPMRESDSKKISSRQRMFFNNYFFLGFGWIAYLIGGYRYNEKYHTHFNPYDPMWANNLFKSFSSIAFTLAMFSSVVMFSTSASSMVMNYFGPWFVFSTWLVVVTFLHHNCPDSKWFSNEKWNYVQGQLNNTVDRTYGQLLDEVTHNIGTHVVHHLFPIIPHYHLVEADKHLAAHTKASNKTLPHHKVVDNVSGLGEFIKYSRQYADNYVVDDKAQEHYMRGGNNKQKSK